MKRVARLFCLLSGAGDAATGALLVLAPQATLALIRAPGPADPAWMRFIGAFVLGVGAVHLYGLAREPRGGARLAHLMEATALVRCVVAAFTGGAVASGALAPAWLSVCLTDATVATAQVVLLRRGAFGREG